MRRCGGKWFLLNFFDELRRRVPTGSKN